jgi:hypothetical protein
LPAFEEKSSLTVAIPGVSALPLLGQERPRTESAETCVLSPVKALPRARGGKIRAVFGWVPGKRDHLIWRPIAAAAALLFLALVLLTHRACTLRSTTDEMARDTDQSTRSAAESKNSLTSPPLSSAAAAPAGARQHLVAEDFTNHFATQAHRKPSVQNPEPKRNAQGSLNRKRVVVN